MGTLYVVATPIGNLEDITYRAIGILREASLVVAEDTRVSRKLLNRVESHAPAISFHEYSDQRGLLPILRALERGGAVAVLTDSGTPGISDPGSFLVFEIIRRLPETKVFTIPGPSALTAALSVSGIRAEPFTFFGFPPEKKGRQSFFASLAGRRETLVIYEAPHRIVKTLDSLGEILGGSRPAFVGRELTKLHETHYRGNLGEVTAAVKQDTLKGEYVIVIGPA
jgi:16S rRNA (cytidine1402-2'-O)-methyltransferase